MIVQVVGAPGAGKSTILPELAHKLDAELVDLGSCRGLDGEILPPAVRFAHWLVATAANPRLALTLARLPRRGHRTIQEAPETVRRDRLMRVLSRCGGSFVVDEGPIHKAVWSAAKSGRRLDPDRFARRLTQPDVVAQVAVAPEVAVDRCIADGSRATFTQWSRSDAMVAVVRYEELLGQVTAALGCPTVVVDDVGVAATRVRNVAGS